MEVLIYFGIGLLIVFIDGLVNAPKKPKKEEMDSWIGATILVTIAWPIFIPFVVLNLGTTINKFFIGKTK
jgi:hypothetical protein